MDLIFEGNIAGMTRYILVIEPFGKIILQFFAIKGKNLMKVPSLTFIHNQEKNINVIYYTPKSISGSVGREIEFSEVILRCI